MHEKTQPIKKMDCVFLVREMRLELTRRLTHAPQTCLSTYSSTLAYSRRCCVCIERPVHPFGGAAFKARGIIADFALLSSSFFLLRRRSVFRIDIVKQREGEIAHGNHENGEERQRTVAHWQQKAHLQIGVIAQQRGELGQQRGGGAAPGGEGENNAQDIGAEEIAIMHVRQQKGDPHGKEHGGTENGAVRETLSVYITYDQQDQHIAEGGCDGDP